MTNTINQIVQHTIEGVLVEGAATLAGDTSDHGGTALNGLAFATGLATAPRALPRKGLGLAATLVVPPGTMAVVYLPGGERREYTPGSYVIWCARVGAILAQWIDTRRRQVTVGPIEGWSCDKWRVRAWFVVDLEVGQPALVATYREPLATLHAAVRAGAMRYIERHSHAAITGATSDESGIDAPATWIKTRLCEDSALEGICIVGVRVLERQGDERQIEAATAAIVAAAQIDEELRVSGARNRACLHELEAKAQIDEREHTLRMAATSAAGRERLLVQQSEVQRAALAARLEIVLAQIHAQTAEISRDEQQWQAEQNRLQGEWDRVQRELISTHTTEQQIRLMDAQQGVLRSEAEVALVSEERRHSHELALAGIQQRLAEQRAMQSQAIAERRAQHDQALLELHLRHEHLVTEQMQSLEQWRVQQLQLGVQQQRQHEKQLAAINGTAQIAAAAAALPTDGPSDHHEVSGEGLRALRDLAE